jgi:dCMP deaminase
MTISVRSDGERDSFLTLNSPIPADPSDATGGGDTSVASRIGGVFIKRVWSRNLQDMLDHVTRDWGNNYVTEDVLSSDDLREFAVRPFVLIVRLDAPILERFRRMTR